MSDYVRDLVSPGLPRVVLGLSGIIVLAAVVLVIFH
jgi:hypothetical protein